MLQIHHALTSLQIHMEKFFTSLPQLPLLIHKTAFPEGKNFLGKKHRYVQEAWYA